MKIKVYGTGTSAHQMVVQMIHEFMLRANVPYSLEEFKEVDMFIKNGIEAIPSVQIGDNLPMVISTSNAEFNHSLRKVIQTILASVDYGELPQYLALFDHSQSATSAFFYGYRLATEMGAVMRVLDVEVSNASSDIVSNKTIDSIIENIDSDWASDLVQNALVEKVDLIHSIQNPVLETIQAMDYRLLCIGCDISLSIFNEIVNVDNTYPILFINKDVGFRDYKNIKLFSLDPHKEWMTNSLVFNIVQIFNAKNIDNQLVDVDIMNFEQLFLTTYSEDTLVVLRKDELTHLLLTTGDLSLIELLKRWSCPVLITT